MGNKIFSNNEASIFYDNIFNWLTNHSFGERRTLDSYKSYSQKLFLPLISKYKCLSEKEELSEIESEFLRNIFYTGQIFRIHPYSKTTRRFVFPTKYYSHWSRNLEGIQYIKNNGIWVLLIGEVTEDNPGIDIFRLLTFIFEYNDIRTMISSRGPRQLLRYENENEIAAVLSKETIKDIRIIDMSDETDYRIIGKSVPQNKWYRKTML